MAADSDGCIVTTVVTCEGNLSDPDFTGRFERVLGKLNGIIGDVVKVRKLEPWNSVRVTLSIPREAALRLRQLASEGSSQLRSLGILSVQVEGDQVISLRLATGSLNSEPQEIILRTAQDGSTSSGSRQETEGGLSRLLSATTVQSVSTNKQASEEVQFKSPNVVCPPDSVVPKVPVSSSNNNNTTPPTAKGYGGPFPFTSMNQAIHSRENLNSANNYAGPPPPPYPGKHPPQPPPPPSPAVAISSPLLVNLLQNDGAPIKTQKSTNDPLVHTTSAVKYPQTTIVNNRTFQQNSYVQKSLTQSLVGSVLSSSAASSSAASSAVQATLSGQNITGARTTLINRTLHNTFVQKSNANFSVTTNSIQSRLLNNTNNNNLEPDVMLNTNISSSITQTPIISKQESPLHINSQASTSSPSALLNTSIRQTNNKLNSTTSSLILSNTNSMGHINYSLTNKLQPPPLITNMTSTKTPLTVPPQSVTAIVTQQTNLSNINFSQTNINNNSQQPPPPPIRTITSSSRILPPPPPYSVAINRTWDSVVQATPLLDLTPSLTDLKVDDLEDLLPTLERDLARSPPEIPEELTSITNDKRNFLINPLTGELEPHSCSESDNEELSDVFNGLPSPASMSDEDTNSTIRPDTTDQSDSETRSSHSDSGKHPRIKNAKVRERGRDSPNLKPTTTEKIKLRLKLEKSEPINSAYKVDVSFIQQQPKKASTSVIQSGEELRVPPLHISLRGRHHAFITNKKKTKLNIDGTSNKSKIRKTQEYLGRLKKHDELINSISNNDGTISSSSTTTTTPTMMTTTTTTTSINSILNSEASEIDKNTNSEIKKVKKFKSNHEHKDLLTNTLLQESDIKSKLLLHNSTHYKEKQKERRGSDSDLVRSSMKFIDTNGIVSVEKKRRLSQSDPTETDQPTILGSTNIGTIVGLPQKPRKDKNKIKDSFKNKEILRNKSYTKNVGDRFTKLPIGEFDVEAIIKQRLLEDSEKRVPRPPHRTETVHQITTENNIIEKPGDVIVKEQSEPPPIKDKSPEPDKCNTPDRKQTDLTDKQSGAQGEDSGIESMDALSEKSPNQASQSPHADITEPIKSKTEVPDMLDIEAQLAKMEGLNGSEDINENQHTPTTKLNQCCELTSALQDSLKQGAVSLSVNANSLPVKDQLEQADVSLVPLKGKSKEDELGPVPVRVTPPLFTYSNPEKSRGPETPSMSDEDSNSCSIINKSKSLLEQLLIDIPENQTPSSPSPATRSVRTRALAKLNSPELNSPASIKQTRSTTPANLKRKRNESESLDDARNKKIRKCSENAAELIKACMGVDASKVNNINKKPPGNKLQDESSDSDEPLIEKVRKTSTNNSVTKNKVKNSHVVLKSSIINTRRSVRTAIPIPNTRSKGDKIHSESDAIRRKTRSAVSEGENKRKKEVK